MDCVISEYNNFIKKLQEKWSFSYNSFVKFCFKKISEHNMAVLHPNQCYVKGLHCFSLKI